MNRTADYSVRVFAIERKRRGEPTRSRRPLNSNYVTNGIARFTAHAHLFGRDDPEGAMVGCIQSHDHQRILAELIPKGG